LIEKEPGEGMRIVENWNNVMMEYMKSQTPSTISQGVRCSAGGGSGVRKKKHRS
jgi:hypothetical protein